jgi:hypothetical protein
MKDGHVTMPLTNAQKQDRYRERHQVLLTARAEEIAEKLIEMADQAKLRKIARLVNDHLTHPDRTPTERSIALGKAKVGGLNGPLGKREALEQLKQPPPGHSCRVEAITKDGKRWSNGVRLSTREEAEVYVHWYARHELEDRGGYVTAEILRCDDEPRNDISRRRAGGRPSLGFTHGECGLLEWRVTGPALELSSAAASGPPPEMLAAVKEAVTDIRRHLLNAQNAKAKRDKSQLAAGQALTELRKQFDAEGRVVGWWEWCASQFAVSRKEIETLLKKMGIVLIRFSAGLSSASASGPFPGALTHA